MSVWSFCRVRAVSASFIVVLRRSRSFVHELTFSCFFFISIIPGIRCYDSKCNYQNDTDRLYLSSSSRPKSTDKVKKWAKLPPVDGWISRQCFPGTHFPALFHTVLSHQVLKICIRFLCLKTYIKT